MQNLKNIVDWKNFFYNIERVNTDKSLDTPSGRFIKEIIISTILQTCSNNNVVYVNENGWDFQYQDIKIESKSQKFCLNTKKGKSKKNTSSIKLKNTLGDSKHAVLNFDALMIVDTGSMDSYAVAYIEKQDITAEMLKYVADGVCIQIPKDKLTFIVDNDTIKKYAIIPNENPQSFMQVIQQAILNNIKIL